MRPAVTMVQLRLPAPKFVRQRPVLFLHAAFWVLLVVLWTMDSARIGRARFFGGAPRDASHLATELHAGRTTRKMAGTRASTTHSTSGPSGAGPIPGRTRQPEIHARRRTKSRWPAPSSRASSCSCLALLCNVGVKLINGDSRSAATTSIGGRWAASAWGCRRWTSCCMRLAGSHARRVGRLSSPFAAISSCRCSSWQARTATWSVGYLRLFEIQRHSRHFHKPLTGWERIIVGWNRAATTTISRNCLVSFFFFPTFVGVATSSGNPRMRLLAASIRLGVSGQPLLPRHQGRSASVHAGLWEALAAMLIPRACLLRACWRSASTCSNAARAAARPATSHELRATGRAVALHSGVWTFFAFIRLFHHGDPSLPETFAISSSGSLQDAA